MSKQINIPDIGSDEVTVTEVMVNVGDTISVDQSIINVEGDKASMEVPAPEAGVVKEVLVKVGDKVSTGTPMLVLEAAGAAPAADAPYCTSGCYRTNSFSYCRSKCARYWI